MELQINLAQYALHDNALPPVNCSGLSGTPHQSIACEPNRKHMKAKKLEKPLMGSLGSCFW